MIELFADLQDKVKKQIEWFVDATLLNSDPFEVVNILNEYTENCQTQEEKDFVQFYLNLRLEDMKNGNFNPKWEKRLGKGYFG